MEAQTLRRANEIAQECNRLSELSQAINNCDKIGLLKWFKGGENERTGFDETASVLYVEEDGLFLELQMAMAKVVNTRLSMLKKEFNAL